MGKLEEYEVMKLLGKGSFGSVYCVRRLAVCSFGDVFSVDDSSSKSGSLSSCYEEDFDPQHACKGKDGH